MEGFWKQQLCFSCSHISLILALHSHASGSGGSVPQLPGSSRAMSLCSSAVLWESCINQDGFFFLFFFFFPPVFFLQTQGSVLSGSVASPRILPLQVS